MKKERNYVSLNDPQFKLNNNPADLFSRLMEASGELQKNRRTEYGTVQQYIEKFLGNAKPIYIKRKLLTASVWWELFGKEYPQITIYLSLNTYFLTQKDQSLFFDLMLHFNKKSGIPIFGF